MICALSRPVAGSYMFNTPISKVVPGACSSEKLTPQERALEFVIFDLSACMRRLGHATHTDAEMTPGARHR